MTEKESHKNHENGSNSGIEERVSRIENELRSLWPCFISDTRDSDNKWGMLLLYACVLTIVVCALVVKVFII